MKFLKILLNSFIISVFLLFISCTAKYYKKSADKEVYKIIKKKGDNIGGMPSNFTIDGDSDILPIDSISTQPVTLSLIKAIEIAVNNSREYQSEKESLYNQALSLTMARHAFDPIFSGKLLGELEHSNNNESVSSNMSLGIRKMIATGADISVSIALNLFRHVAGAEPQENSGAVFNASLTQPLLRGAGKKVALENLTQAERQMVYAIRNFVRYRKKFSVNIAKKYFDVLKLKEIMDNNWKNYENLRIERERAELLAKAGRLPAFQVDQTKQNEFSAEDSWIRAKQSYENGLDRFKMQLGLPADMKIDLDPDEMKKLAAKGIAPKIVSLDTATTIALQNRLDLKNTIDGVEDSKRKIDIAKNSLLPKADLVLSYQNSSHDKNKPLSFTSTYDTASIGLDIDPILDRKSNRNMYRQSLINYNSAKRNLTESVDNITLEVRDTFRALEQSEKRYIIQSNSVKLAEKRVESTTMLQEAGRASTRDVLDARESLLDAQNALTSALVDNYNSCLDLFITMEILRIDDNGLWMEVNNIE